MRKPRYELTAAARLDLLQIWNYLAERASLDLADKTLADIQAGIEKVARTPGRGHVRPDLTTRELLFYRVHSYLIVYRANVKPLHVVRVLHAARDVREILEQ